MEVKAKRLRLQDLSYMNMSNNVTVSHFIKESLLPSVNQKLCNGMLEIS